MRKVDTERKRSQKCGSVETISGALSCKANVLSQLMITPRSRAMSMKAACRRKGGRER